MRTRLRQSGLTLPEIAVVIATIALLVGFALPAIRALLDSFETQSGAKTLISTALASARAIAAKEQRYAGVRFQKDLAGNQYMIFIVQDPTIMAYGFRAVEDVKPIKLPKSSGVMDLAVVTDRSSGTYGEIQFDGQLVDSAQKEVLLSDLRALTDISTFSVVFSPSGKLVIHRIQVRNRDGIADTKSNQFTTSYDRVFNKKGDVDKQTPELVQMGMGKEIGMFYQDDYFGVLDIPDYPDLGNIRDLGLGPELSRKRLVIYDRAQFDKFNAVGKVNYIDSLDVIYINAYTGTMILPD